MPEASSLWRVLRRGGCYCLGCYSWYLFAGAQLWDGSCCGLRVQHLGTPGGGEAAEKERCGRTYREEAGWGRRIFLGCLGDPELEGRGDTAP